MTAGAAAALVFLTPVRPAWVDLWPIPSAWIHRAATPIGVIRRVRLEDGSSVTLDTDTIVVSQFSASARRLTLLRGRARFDVAHDPARPFIVTAGGGSVTARGTLFDVSMISARKVAVTLIRGVVDVKAPAGGAVAATLAPGQQYTFGRAVPAPRVRPASPAGALWPSGFLTFQATPLSEAVAQANRYSRRHIRLASPALASVQVSGMFQATAPGALAQSLAAAFDLRVKDDSDGDFVLDEPGSPTIAPAG